MDTKYIPPTPQQLESIARYKAKLASAPIIESTTNSIPDWMNIAQTVLRLTGNGERVITFVVSVMDGNVPGTLVKDRLKAAEILLDRGFGRPVADIHLSGEIKHKHVLESWTDAELQALVDVRRMITGIVDPTKVVDMPLAPNLDTVSHPIWDTSFSDLETEADFSLDSSLDSTESAI